MTGRLRSFQTNYGFTLIEIIMTILILGLSSLILVPYFGAIISSPDPVLRERAVALGQSMMDEILAKKWDENTPIGGGPIRTSLESDRGIPAPASGLGTDALETAVRNTWDDVDDYNGLSETNTFSDRNNVSFTLTGYSRSVQVDYISSAAPTIDQSTGPAANSTDTKRIIVTVTAPNNETFTLVAVSCNF